MKLHSVAPALALATLAVMGTAIAETPDSKNFVAHLSGDEEVPVRETLAQGQAVFHLSKDGSTLSYKLIVANIENVVAAHIHLGAFGATGARSRSSPAVCAGRAGGRRSPRTSPPPTLSDPTGRTFGSGHGHAKRRTT
jgi:hypothetical protein